MKWTVQRRLFGLSILLIALTALVAWVGNWGLQTVQQANTAKEQALLRMVEVQQLERDLIELAYAASAYTATVDPAQKQTFMETRNRVSAMLDSLAQAADGDAEMATLIDGVQRRFTEFVAFAERLLSRDRFEQAEINWMSRSLETVRNNNSAALASLLEHHRTRVEQTSREAAEAVQLTQIIAAGAAGLAVLLGLAISFLVARKITRPVEALAQAARRLASGDLTPEVTRALENVRGRDELAEMAGSFNQMVAFLRDLVVRMQGTVQTGLQVSGDLSSAAAQAASAAQDAARAVTVVAEGTSQQAAAARNIDTVIQELRESIRQIASGANRSSGDLEEASSLLHRAAKAIEQMTAQADQVAGSAEEAARIASEGAGAVEEMVQSMARIREVVGMSTARMGELEEASAQIGQITAVISEIADQTNLLALNAAIEAARAGEHGRGFAVVAEEVRRLAERSAASAQEISALITQIQERTAQVVESMAEGSTEVEQGGRLASRAGEQLEQILQTVRRAAEDVRKVAVGAANLQREVDVAMKAFEGFAAVTAENTAATEEMADSANEALSTVSAIVDAAQQNAAAAEQVSASVEELAAVADGVASHAESLNQITTGLKEQVGNFRV
ncbi:methyl-accepting chemotaxis protein [Symbiobacterium terraclitae]|uniref:Methyl-accepting chemotaxis protein n=1 Tax=Symbiobacterium terraclitae TaxID=557451 RepID=A0ABS4JNB8_9FIRM|nr:HAMP domain-containing methyl-accepting chemotaxis protein [Symbiobacterium terraclitae]MBP2017032.1 methyl-accepting chemotaxis protein [Symbiobacterium terraclitae]